MTTVNGSESDMLGKGSVRACRSRSVPIYSKLTFNELAISVEPLNRIQTDSFMGS